MTARSSAPDVRNPLLAFEEAVAALQALPPESQAALRTLLGAMSADARLRAEQCWRKHKAPMAVYWKGWAVYTRHARQLLRAAA